MHNCLIWHAALTQFSDAHLHLSGRGRAVGEGTRLIDEHGVGDGTALCAPLLLRALQLLQLLLQHLQARSARVRGRGVLLLAGPTARVPWRVPGRGKTLPRLLGRRSAIRRGRAVRRFAGVALQQHLVELSRQPRWQATAHVTAPSYKA